MIQNQCQICKKLLPQTFIVRHHVRPQAVGGTKKDEINLCGGCHDNLHRVTDLIINQKINEAADAVTLAYSDNPQAREAIIKYAKIAAYWFSTKRDGINSNDINDKTKLDIKIELSVGERQALKLMAAERNISQQKLITEILKQTIYKKFPKLRK